MNQFRMYARGDRGGTFYWQDTISGRQGTLKTKDRKDAEILLNAKNESSRQAHLNRELGRVYLKAADAAFATRTWQDAMNSYCARGELREASRERPSRAFAGKHFDSIRRLVIAETSTETLLGLMEKAGNSTTDHFMRRLHNYAVGLGWLPWNIVPKLSWPQRDRQTRRAITAEEHAMILGAEANVERRHFYELLWITGCSQSDGAEVTADKVDWENGILCFQRKKLKSDATPCMLRIGPALAELLRKLPQEGPLFPSMKRMDSKHRAAEFCRRCRLLKIRGISLHSYRYGWAERAEKAGMPERYAQVALGHASKAVHRAYAKGAAVAVPSLDNYEQQARNVVAFPNTSGFAGKSNVGDSAILKSLLPEIRKAVLVAGRENAARLLGTLSDEFLSETTEAVTKSCR